MPDLTLLPDTTSTAITVNKADGTVHSTLVRETSYQLDSNDWLILSLSTIEIQRNGYGDPLREELRLEQHGGDLIGDAIVTLVRTVQRELRNPYCTDNCRQRYESFLSRVRAAAAEPQSYSSELPQPELLTVSVCDTSIPAI